MKFNPLLQVDSTEEEAGVVKDLYELIEKYHVPTPPEDLAVYQVHTHNNYLNDHFVFITLIMGGGKVRH